MANEQSDSRKAAAERSARRYREEALKTAETPPKKERSRSRDLARARLCGCT